jgi:hypothetical protein
MEGPVPLSVLAIDVGTRNFAFCFLTKATIHRPPIWHKEQVCLEAAPKEQDIIRCMKVWINNNYITLKGASVIILETQLRDNFKCMNIVLQTMFDHCHVVSPNTIGAFYRLPKKREFKKKAAVDLVKSILPIPPNFQKQDDLADCYLMALWGLLYCGAISREEILHMLPKN